MLSAAAMCITVGNKSFEDWLILTWSLGWTGALAPSEPVSARLDSDGGAIDNRSMNDFP